MSNLILIDQMGYCGFSVMVRILLGTEKKTSV